MNTKDSTTAAPVATHPAPPRQDGPYSAAKPAPPPPGALRLPRIPADDGAPVADVPPRGDITKHFAGGIAGTGNSSGPDGKSHYGAESGGPLGGSDKSGKPTGPGDVHAAGSAGESSGDKAGVHKQPAQSTSGANGTTEGSNSEGTAATDKEQR